MVYIIVNNKLWEARKIVRAPNHKQMFQNWIFTYPVTMETSWQKNLPNPSSPEVLQDWRDTQQKII